MASVHRLPTLGQRHSIEELIQIRRDMLRYARSFPPGLTAISTGRSPYRFVPCSRTGIGCTPIRGKEQRASLIVLRLPR